MTKKKPNKSTLKQLIKEWDEKLKSEGFHDIEDRNTGLLKSWSGEVVWDPGEYETPPEKTDGRYSTLVWKESQAEYYRLAGILVHEGIFKSELYKHIWELHAEGISDYQIADKLQLTYRKVRYAVECMQIQFGLKCRK